MAWWLWVLVGFGLFLCELLTPGGFFFIFFGVGALVVGMLAALGIAGSPPVQWLLFTIVSLACLIPLRARLVRWMQPGEGRAVDQIAGETAVLLEELRPGAVGKAELRGTAWNVRTAGAGVLPRGARVRVVRVDGLTLWVEAE